MYKRPAIILFLLFLLPCLLRAQDFTEYAPLQNTMLPVDYSNIAAERYIALSDAYNGTHYDKKTRKMQRQKEAFFLQNNYVIQDLFESGAILFDAAYSNYLKSIAAKVLEKDTVLLKTAQFYLVRSPAVNAFATQDGSVFIYMGLMATLRTEAELAFVISHELSHVRKQHALDFFIKNADIEAQTARNARKNLDNNTANLLKRLNNYSQQNEMEADAYGFQTYFATSDYTQTAPEGVLNVLRYGYLPFGNKPFEKGFFEDKNLVFPDNYELENLRQISKGSENEASERNTHPSIATRRAQLRQLMSENERKNAKTSDFLVSEAVFRKWKRSCKFELPMLFLHYNDFQEAIYSAYLLLHEAPKDLYLKKCVAKGLYGFAKFRNDTTETCAAETIKYNDIEGEAQQLYHFLEQLDGAELTILAYNYTQNLTEQYNDNELKMLQTDLIAEFVRYYFNNTTEIARFIQENKAIYYTNTLNRFLDHDIFIKKYKIEVNKNKNSAKPVFLTINAKKTLNLHIPKIIIVNNTFKSVDMRTETGISKNKIEYNESTLGATRFERAVADNARKAKLDYLLLPTTPTANTRASLQLFNSRIALNDWLAEQLAYGNMPFRGYQHDRIKAIAEQMDCDYFLWTGAVQMRQPKDGFNIAANIALGVGVYPLLPFAAYSIAKADYDTLIYGILYNVETQESHLVKYETVQGNMPNAVINSHLYDMFRQICD